MRHSDTLTELGAALAAAQAEVQNPPLDGVNPHYRSKYTTLATMLDTVKPVFAKHGLALVQFPITEDGRVGIETVVLHSSGEWIAETALIGAADDPQKAGSILTYARRYGVAAVAGIQGEEDTDAEGAMPRQTAPRQTAQPAQTSSVKEASDKQRKMLFAVASKAQMMDVVEPVVHAIKAENGGIIPMAWMRQRLDEISDKETPTDWTYFRKTHEAILASRDADQKKGDSKEPDGSESFEEWANAQHDEDDVPF
jgi:hypothetical protein